MLKLWVGTSGYSYKEWKGSFYPEDLPATKMLSYYAKHLSSVEINNTFYRFPKESVLESWAQHVPEQLLGANAVRPGTLPLVGWHDALALLGQSRLGPTSRVH